MGLIIKSTGKLTDKFELVQATRWDVHDPLTDMVNSIMKKEEKNAFKIWGNLILMIMKVSSFSKSRFNIPSKRKSNISFNMGKSI
ncbi:MAG: hypothetical protein Ct9H300mP18_08210 [Candidatus Neomarinimicrobiota bacterium]|nr:MAG: hypothetical protein Ct9H300mP18_08210 [Candidatus Neomarinimicrobiota bacterium]